MGGHSSSPLPSPPSSSCRSAVDILALLFFVVWSARGPRPTAVEAFCVAPTRAHRRRQQHRPAVRCALFAQNRRRSTAASGTSTGTKTTTELETKTAGAAAGVTEGLSDVDARVLRSMLTEKKLNLETEDDVRKLLERGTVKRIPSPVPQRKADDGDGSEFSSSILKTLADTKLWKRVSAQAGDALESMGIWVSNKVEQDVKVLAALGLFAWDRAVYDVARALPAAASAPKVFRLAAHTNSTSASSSSFDDDGDGAADTQKKDLLREMNRPADEIKSVSRELLGILSGERTGATATNRKNNNSNKNSGGGAAFNRGLRTAAPAGGANAAERQRRALFQRRALERQRQIDVTKIGGGVVDAAWELRRELAAETSVPGYKTKPMRQALGAGVAAVTGRVLRGVGRGQERLAAAAAVQPRQRLAEATRADASAATGTNKTSGAAAATTIESGHDDAPDALRNDDEDRDAGDRRRPIPAPNRIPFFAGHVRDATVSPSVPGQEVVVTLAELSAERERIVNRLTLCIDDPSSSWLTPTVIDRLDNLDFFAGPGMQRCLTKLIHLREEFQDVPRNDAASVEGSIDELLSMRAAIQELCTVMASDVSFLIADQMRFELLERGESTVDDEEKTPLILRLEVFRYDISAADKPTARATTPAAVAVEKLDVVPVEGKVSSPEMYDVIPDAVFLDVIPDAFVMDTHDGVFVDDGMDAADAGLMAEIVTDDDFESAVGAAKVAFGDDESEKKQDTFVIQATLRSLDVVFFLVERVLTVGVPGTVAMLATAMARVEGVNRNGRGSVGWKQLGNLASTKGRY